MSNKKFYWLKLEAKFFDDLRIQKLRNISGHSADFILYGFDDTTITKTKECLQHYSEEEFIYATKIITQIATFIKNT